MLILSRKKGESIKIGDDIEIFVSEIKGDKVRLGISAPGDMKICRTELYLTMENNKEASDKVRSLTVAILTGMPMQINFRDLRHRIRHITELYIQKNSEKALILQRQQLSL